MNELLIKIKASFASEILWIVTGIILTKVVDVGIKLWKKHIRKRNLHKSIENGNQFSLQHLDILSLDHADPTYELHDILIRQTNRSLYLDCPSDIKSRIREFNEHFTFHSDNSFDKTNSFSDLESITAITHLSSLIDEHKRIVGNQFIKKLEEGRTIFNGKKYGIYRIIRDRKDEHEENAGVSLDLFETDYYTHMVFRSIYKQLKAEGHPIGTIQKMEELNPYTPFLTSFGMNTLLITEAKGKEEVILAKRSKYISSPNSPSRWHVSMNEGLTSTDLEGKDVSLIKCLHRGLREELGIREEHHRRITDEKFMDLFLESSKLEIGITSYVKTELSYDETYDLYSIAKDGELETDGLTSVPLKKKTVANFTQSYDLTPACQYTLKMYLARQKSLT